MEDINRNVRKTQNAMGSKPSFFMLGWLFFIGAMLTPGLSRSQAVGLDRQKGDTSFKIPDTLTYAKSQEIDYAFNFYNGDTVKYYRTKSGFYIGVGTVLTIGRPFTGITLYNPNTYRYEVKYHVVHEGRANLVRTNPEGVAERLEGQDFAIQDMVVFHTRPGRKSSVKVVIYAKSVNSKRIITISDIERAIFVGEVMNKFK